MAKEVVANIPIGAYVQKSIGYYSFAFQTEELAHLLNVDSLYCLNTSGVKTGKKQDVGAHLREIDLFGVTPTDVWVDSQKVDPRLVSQAINRGVEDGWIRETTGQVLRCECGLTEVLPIVPRLSARELSTYSTRGEAVICGVCSSTAGLIDSQILLMNLRTPSLDQIFFYPNFISKEIRQTIVDFSKYGLLISRGRQTGLDYFSDETEYKYNLDPDLNWMLMAYFLSTQDQISLNTLITGTRASKQTSLLLMATEMLDCPLPKNIIAIPKVTTDQDRSNSHSPDDFMKNLGVIGSRSFLTSIIGNRQKEVALPIKQSLLLGHHYQKFPRNSFEKTTDSRPSLRQVLNGHNHEEVGSISRNVRLDGKNTAYQNWLLNEIILRTPTPRETT